MSLQQSKDIERIVKPGDVLAGKYLVERVLGAGGMGFVVAATHTQLDQRVAIKLLLPNKLPDPELVERFQREARAAARIRSDHVVRVSDVGALPNGVPFMVMELLDGHDLGHLLQTRGAMPFPLAVDYLLEACEALAEAHAAGIVHRDLKPANLFLARRPDETEIVKILDFGISKQLSPEIGPQSNPGLTKTTDVFGSPTYMSPEQLRASRDVDMRADIWALGVILHELVAGKPPFEGGTVAEIFGAILHQPAPRLRASRKDTPEGLERAVLRCLEKDASRRYNSVVELAEALAPFGSDAARVSLSRVTRTLRGGPQSRAGVPSARGSLPSIPEVGSASNPAVQASTGGSAEKGDRQSLPDEREISAAPGGATSTSWGHVQPAAKPGSAGRLALLAVLLLAASAAGAFFVLRILSASPGSGASAASAGSAIPTAELAPPGQSGTTVVAPASSGGAGSPPAGASVAAPPASVAVTPSVKSTGKLPVGASPSGSTKPSAAPTTKADAPTTPPKPGGDDDFGGRR